MTQYESALKGEITPEMQEVAREENLDSRDLCESIARGEVIIVKSKKHDCRPMGIGKGLRIKINANIGTSGYSSDLSQEIKKMDLAVKYGAHTIMDLSTGGPIDEIRCEILKAAKVPVGTVPIYQVLTEGADVADITAEDFLASIRKHIDDGVDFVTVHCGLRKEHLPLLGKRIMGVVSRGGSFLVKWMMHHGEENPLYTHYDRILEMAKTNDVALSLGDGLRPGCLADATDEAQLAELKTLGDLTLRAREEGIQVMVEGPGHVPLHQVQENMELQKKYCHGAPFYVLGPLVTDISPGYDHIAGAIGGAIAGMHGADFLCYLTPTEHLGLPEAEHVIDGVVASKIAAHAADIARGLKGARDRDDAMARARSNLDWEKMYNLSLNPEKARYIRKEQCLEDQEVCTMCGNYCSAKINKEVRGAF